MSQKIVKRREMEVCDISYRTHHPKLKSECQKTLDDFVCLYENPYDQSECDEYYACAQKKSLRLQHLDFRLE